MVINGAPKVSVLMPTFNYGRFISEAIESVTSQTFRDLELLVVDNCSTDDTAEQVERHALKDPRIRFIRNESNLGMVGNWNRCLTHASGEYIKFMFSDDSFLMHDAIEKMVQLMDSDSGLSLVASSRELIDVSSKRLGVLSDHRGALVQEGMKVLADCLIDQKNRIGEPSAVLFRKDQAKRGFDERYKQIVDLEMWFHLLEQGKFGYIASPLVSFRVHPGQQTQQNIRGSSLTDEPFLLLETYADKAYHGLSRIDRAYMHYVPVYSIWKLYAKHGKISRSEALAQIEKQYPILRFYSLYPFFKLLKLIRR